MRTDETKKKDRSGAAETRLAAECKTLVISSASGLPDRAETLSALIREGGKDGRFDLLTAVDPARLAVPGPLLDQVASDAKLAVQLHHGEQIVVAVYGDPSPIVRALKRRDEFKDGGVEIRGIDLTRHARRGAKLVETPTLAVTCMDFRQHDGSLAELIQAELDCDDVPAVLATAGGAKDLVEAHPRGRLILDQIAASRRRCSFKQVVLTCHTDCGAMGGDAAPAFCRGDGRPDAKLQAKVLEERLRAAALSFRIAFPKAEILAAIVRLKDGRIDAVVPTVV